MVFNLAIVDKCTLHPMRLLITWFMAIIRTVLWHRVVYCKRSSHLGECLVVLTVVI